MIWTLGAFITALVELVELVEFWGAFITALVEVVELVEFFGAFIAHL